MEQMSSAQKKQQPAQSWAAFYQSGSIRDYLQYRNCARQEESPYAPNRQGSGDPGDSLRRK